MRLPLRSLGTLLVAVGVATCSDSPRAVVKTAPEGQAGIGRFSISPRFSPQAAAIYARRATFATANFDHVRIVITRPPNEVVIDTVITFNPASPPATLELFVDVKTTNEIFDGTLQYTNNGVVVYSASGKIQSHPPDEPAPAQQELVVAYVGPGATASRLVVTPQTSSVIAPGSASFTATAFDANNTPVNDAPISWTVSDASIATLSATNGASTSITTSNKRGSVTVTASTPTLSANATVTVSLPPASITLVSGGGQTGKAGSALASPAVVQVNAVDGLGVAGVSVQFAAPAGGSVGSTSATTDANGRASSSLTLGSTVGPQSFAASAAGFSVSIPATATPADPAAIAVFSGSGQTDTVNRALRAPFVVKVSDRFGNGVSGVTVNWSKVSGAGTLGGATSVTGTDGTASMGYTLGATPGTETVSASVSTLATSVTFTATAITGPANIVAVSGSGQTGRVGQALAAPLVVRVTDAAGTPVSGAVVLWSATNGTVSGGGSTDAQGQASATFTLGTAVGGASATASVNTAAGVRSATFAATVQAGIVARAVFRVGPSNVATGGVITPSVQVELQDAGGNRTNAVNAVSIALGTNPSQATLGGTLTRNAVAGIATFNDLTVSAAGTGFTLVASSAGVPSVTSGPFNVTGSAPSNRMLLVDQQTLTPLPTQPPPSVTMTAGTTPANPPAIQVLDSQGHPLPNATVSYTVTRGTQTLFSGAPQTNAQGIITFATLAISPNNMQVAGNYSFVATLAGATGSPLTLPVTVVPASPAQYLVTASTTTPAAGAPSTITAQLADQFSNAIATAGNTVSWTLSGAGGGSLSGATSQTNAQGQATIVYTSAAQPSGATVTVTATDAGTPSITGAVTLTPQVVPLGPPARLAIVTQPSATAVSLQPLAQQPVLQVVDANGNAVPTPTPISVGAVWSAGSERNNVVQTNAQGVATFTSLAVVGGGTAPIVFSATGLTSASSINVTSTVPATALQFAVQPTNVFVNSPFSPVVQVRIVDANNNTVTTANNTITMAIGTNPANGGLAGNVTVNAVNGVATFTNININTAGTGYTLVASATGLTSATSTAFNVLPPPNSLAINSVPTTIINDVVFSPPITVQLMSSGSNVPLAGVTVTASYAMSLGSHPPPSITTAAAARRNAGRGNARANMQAASQPPTTVITNNTAVTDANGVATFTGMKVTGYVQYFRMAFDAQGPGFVVTDTTGDIFLDAGPATSMVILSGDAQSGAAGAALSIDPTVALVDVSGNFTSAPPTTVTFATSNGAVTPTSVVTDQFGFASTQWTMPSSQGPATMTASATINGAPVSLTFTASATSAPPATLTAVSPAIGITQVGTPLAGTSYPKVRVRDQSGAAIANSRVDFQIYGACAASPITVSVFTDAVGEAGLTSSNLNVPTNAPGSCEVFAFSASNGNLFAKFGVFVAPVGAKTWTGAATNDWTDANSWLPAGVPTASDPVFIPSFPMQFGQVTTANATAGGLTVESFSGLVMVLQQGSTLTVNGSIDAGTAGGVSSASTSGPLLIVNASGPATLTGFLNTPVQIGANTSSCGSSYALTGTFSTMSATINCPLDLAANGYNISGTLMVQNQGRLAMTQSQAVLIVGGDATFQGQSESGFLTAGAISINGQLRVNSNVSTTPFMQGPNATLQLTGAPTGITVGLNVSPLTFGSLSLPNGAATFNSAAPLSAAALLQGSSLIVGSGTSLAVSGTTIFANGSTTNLSNGSLNLTGSVNFLGNSSVVGGGTISVVAASCTKQSTATVNVTGNSPPFTASAQQCSNQIP